MPLSDYERKIIVAAFNQSGSTRTYSGTQRRLQAEGICTSHQMVANTIAKYQATGMVKDRKRSGRPKSNKTKEKQRTLEPIEQHQVWMHRALP